MSTLTKRQLLTGGVATLVGATGLGYALTATGRTQAFEHRALSVEEMRATGGLIVDIRTPPEWSQTGVIEGARLVEFDFKNPASFLQQIGGEIADGRDLVIICRSGNRTQVAGDYLAKQIDNRVISIAGGMKGVIGAGYRPVAPN